KDIAKISRKRSKPDNHGHGNGIECAKAGECYQEFNIIRGFHWSIPKRERHAYKEGNTPRIDFYTKRSTKEAQECHITDCHAGNPCELRFDLTDHNGDPIIGRNEEPGLMGSCNKP
ncbi:hypothetical protein Tco_0947027, partial [Tanacetum coccineum]